MIAISYDDVVYTAVPDACYKIVRHWSIINWCVVGDAIDNEVVDYIVFKYCCTYYEFNINHKINRVVYLIRRQL